MACEEYQRSADRGIAVFFSVGRECSQLQLVWCATLASDAWDGVALRTGELGTSTCFRKLSLSLDCDSP